MVFDPCKVAARRAVAIALAMLLFLMPIPGGAAPPKPSAVSSIVKDGRTWHLKVYSAAMGKEVAVDVLRPVDTSRPAPDLYMLNGLDAGEGPMNWQKQTTAIQWLGSKPINVVQPIGGRGSYYTDWDKPDPRLGVNKWKTFLTTELPPLLDRTLHSTGLNALTGLSMSGISVLQLAEAKPGLWKSVAAYSGCAQIADPMGRMFVNLVIGLWAGGNPQNMYGPADSPEWVQNDPLVNAEKLRGTLLYISSGNGLPTPVDIQNYQKQARGGPAGDVNLGLGMIIEAAADQCTHNLQTRLDTLRIPATFQFTPTGTHYWPYWEEALHNSWPLLAQGMGLKG